MDKKKVMYGREGMMYPENRPSLNFLRSLLPIIPRLRGKGTVRRETNEGLYSLLYYPHQPRTQVPPSRLMITTHDV